ncbi:MAG: 2-oxoacid:acceptor oxidoreductase family protein [Candidatus Bathyarchaeia archaeon]
MRYEVRIAGLGGQGIVLLGVILAKAIASNDKLHVVQTQSYGPESRGGAVRADLVISDEPVDYPKVRKADVLVAMSQTAFETYLGNLKEKGTLVIDPSLVTPETRRSITVKEVDATKKASQLGKVILANMIMLGALIDIINLASKEAVINALKGSVSAKNLSEDMRALEVGLEAGVQAE